MTGYLFCLVYQWKRRPVTCYQHFHHSECFIHRNRCMKSRPKFSVHKEPCHYFSSLKCLEKKKALKLSSPPFIYLFIYFTFLFSQLKKKNDEKKQQKKHLLASHDAGNGRSSRVDCVSDIGLQANLRANVRNLKACYVYGSAWQCVSF